MRLQNRLTTVNLSVLFVFLAFLSPAVATVTDQTDFSSRKRYGHVITKSDASVGFPYFLSSFTGLLIDDGEDKGGEANGLDLVRRAPDGGSLGNNKFESREILMGEIQYWHFSNSFAGTSTVNSTSDTPETSTAKRATSTVYVSLTICSKPILNESVSGATQDLPQLAVYVSTSDSLREPGPDKDSKDQTVHHSEEGYMSAMVPTESGVYIGVAAPNSGKFSGSYSYQLAASTDDFFHKFADHSTLLTLVDADSEAALLTTEAPADRILTEDQLKQWRNSTGVYNIFINNANNSPVAGMSRSYCALEQHSQVGTGDGVEASMSTRKRTNNELQQQFYITGLNRSSTYNGVLAMSGNSSDSGNGVGGGGMVWRPEPFTTKSDRNCAVIYDLDFCSDIAYAVPSNPSMNLSQLRSKYDSHAEDLYKNFNYSLQQIQCNTSNETIFSMTVNCTVCATAYKDWLCAVTIPKCDDFSSTKNTSAVMIRNAAQAFPNGTEITNKTLREDPVRNRSRNDLFIDKEIEPGPYKEVLPSIDVCHDLVRNCPMALGFQCPTGKWLQYSYSLSAGSILGTPSSLGFQAIILAAASGLLWLF
ncbi:MID1 family protein [Aspergillus lucknowensis]|uniref:Stretch-activated Ca2+-permeable channel component-domain-containing protein n=1 Tax=Aspergillus lucknowensis TaxID=176173 RepID=A0ABR4LSD9_9EURO